MECNNKDLNKLDHINILQIKFKNIKTKYKKINSHRWMDKMINSIIINKIINKIASKIIRKEMNIHNCIMIILKIHHQHKDYKTMKNRCHLNKSTLHNKLKILRVTS